MEWIVFEEDCKRMDEAVNNWPKENMICLCQSQFLNLHARYMEDKVDAGMGCYTS